MIDQTTTPFSTLGKYAHENPCKVILSVAFFAVASSFLIIGARNWSGNLHTQNKETAITTTIISGLYNLLFVCGIKYALSKNKFGLLDLLKNAMPCTITPEHRAEETQELNPSV